MLFSDCFMRLPPTTAVLLLSSVFTLTEAGALPRQTQAHIALRTLDVRDWPLATPAPWLGMMRRQEDSSTNTICGYVGGDPNLPATCSAGSHCAMDASASAVGCCPNGAACTTGVYTSCVDDSSPTQTASDPYIFTCQGSNVCYRNSFEGGAYQYGCGSTTQGNTVYPTASGLSTTVSITEISGLVTRAATSSSTSSSSSSSTSSTTSTTSSSSSQTSSSSSTSSTSRSSTTESAMPTAEASSPPSSAAGPPPGAAAALRRHGGIIGGVIGGAAVFVAIVSMALWMRKRKRGNQRHGPGVGKGPTYVPEPNSKEFAPVPGGEMMFDQAGYGHPSMMPGAHGTTTSISGGKAATTPPSSAPGAITLPANEIDEFSQGYHDAVTPGHEEHRATSSGSNTGGNPYGAGAGANSEQQADVADERPLWQQNRRQSRNLSWM
ncbi:uncharacterized protein ColSpa_05549 [Colletotrichum spaethianum]|uniref:Mid2 domain-containing protein n=1 Tax=Colletotrichum spaethianum TaxID=700344 RepID=A0AA37P1U2_9PEZI|nr:uncharacterized protein ColSpa_05549 [Colletotrichum spaethianum]GKT45368.1 hypothetical protein ColSpa_05549 [Colletotrichum spaethianum]